MVNLLFQFRSLAILLVMAASIAINFSQVAAADEKPSKPNVILIVADDLGWSDLGCYGGDIQTPNLDRLASAGLRFSQFYNSAKCEATRSCLMSGQYWQDTGIGVKRGLTMGQVMKACGYDTYAVGKWHLDGNPFERGFDHYFGHLSGASDYFKGNPSHRLDDKPFKPKDDKFYTTDANADYAIEFISESVKERPDTPFFMYLAFNAPHGPLQAWPEDIAKYRGKYKAGWDKLRQQRYQRMIEKGVFKADWPLSARPETIPAWDSLSEKEQDLEDLRMSIFAAMVDRMDQAIGRVLKTVKDLGQEENTLVIFISDNGGSPYDRGRIGTLPEKTARWEYGIGWAHLSNTPYRHYKRNMFNGGSCTPCIAYWPASIKRPGTVTDQPAHIIDLMATFLDVGQGNWPAKHAGESIAPLPGKSLRPIFAGETREPHDALYFQLFDHRAIVSGDWKLASDWNEPWQLFNIANDRAEINDLKQHRPEEAKALQAKWETWAAKNGADHLKNAGGEPIYRSLTEKKDANSKPKRRQQKKAAS